MKRKWTKGTNAPTFFFVVWLLTSYGQVPRYTQLSRRRMGSVVWNWEHKEH
jgi:hypothetical protein